MSLRIIDYKKVDMIKDEYEYYEKLVTEFSSPGVSGKEHFRDLFEVDSDGCISMIRPPMKREVGWAIILFLQNLMINQRLRRMENWFKEIKSGEKHDKTNDSGE